MEFPEVMKMEMKKWLLKIISLLIQKKILKNNYYLGI